MFIFFPYRYLHCTWIKVFILERCMILYNLTNRFRSKKSVKRKKNRKPPTAFLRFTASIITNLLTHQTRKVSPVSQPRLVATYYCAQTTNNNASDSPWPITHLLKRCAVVVAALDSAPIRRIIANIRTAHNDQNINKSWCVRCVKLTSRRHSTLPFSFLQLLGGSRVCHFEYHTAQPWLTYMDATFNGAMIVNPQYYLTVVVSAFW